MVNHRRYNFPLPHLGQRRRSDLVKMIQKFFIAKPCLFLEREKFLSRSLTIRSISQCLSEHIPLKRYCPLRKRVEVAALYCTILAAPGSDNNVQPHQHTINAASI